MSQCPMYRQIFIKTGSTLLKQKSSVAMKITRTYSTNTKMGRGAFILLEGCDRCGKTTQCQKIVQGLKKNGIAVKKYTFPDRSTPIGHMIDEYLRSSCELEDHAIHLLFTANRWELKNRMEEDLMKGISLIVDRYAFSGIAFSAAKPNVDFDWCCEPESGLIQPDVVLYFDVSVEEAAERGKFGEERYEKLSFQKKVAKNYKKLFTSDWKIIDGKKSIDDVYADAMSNVSEVIKNVRDKPLRTLEIPQQNKSVSDLELKLNGESDVNEYH